MTATGLLMGIFAFAAWPLAAHCEVLRYSAHPEASNNFAEASFACFIPKGEKLRGILFVAFGTNSDGRPVVDDPEWRALAEAEQLVLIGGHFRGEGEAYEVASRGSGQALLKAVEKFAGAAGNAAIAELPIILYGHSAGAQFAYNFALWRPKRVAGIVCVKSGPLAEPDAGSDVLFPALYIVGEKDQSGRIRTVAKAFAYGRKKSAPWCLALQPDAGHGAEGCKDLAHKFIRAVLRSSDVAEFAKLNNLDAAGGRTDAIS